MTGHHVQLTVGKHTMQLRRLDLVDGWQHELAALLREVADYLDILGRRARRRAREQPRDRVHIVRWGEQPPP